MIVQNIGRWMRYALSNPALGWGLFLMVAGLCAGSVSVLHLGEDQGATLAQLAGALGTVGGVMIALGTFLLQGEDRKSRFYLDESLKGLAEAHSLLADGNNDRITWVLAARILSRVRSISRGISTPEHIDVWEISRESYRIKFHDILKYGTDNQGAFFLGFDDPEEPMEKAAERQSKCHEYKYIPESAIAEIYEFTEYDKDYNDPIGKRLSDGQITAIRYRSRSLHRYINFLRKRRIPYACARSMRDDEFDD